MSITAENGTCHGCGRELYGAVEMVLIGRGPFVTVAFKETPDCNWVKCSGCGKAVCKSCGRFLKVLAKMWKDRQDRMRNADSNRAAAPNSADHNVPSSRSVGAPAFGKNGGNYDS